MTKADVRAQVGLTVEAEVTVRAVADVQVAVVRARVHG